ncbi:pyridoxal phosphate-dependent aminotransferase [Nannocystis bainbridge]|uniref:Aminotransferase n=1 Tax=Nannocystis bainbridge TaxID=2995303 RepID=A0ABT5E457_9BACT|nr:pyridoxal phosphate-dependent aminotransferase [Nannocystis bainbridge]MDC0720114.1 pyridoxal phosphate-dependent aminotransferase [Nannocystis bainbridge]
MTAAPSLSRRGLDAPASPIRRLTPYADQARARGVTVHHLNIGQPDLATVQPMLAAYQAYDERVVAYSPSEGYLAYRTALAEHYNGLDAARGGGPITPDQILVTVGGSEALLFAIAAMCDVGDQILVAEPYYTNYRGFSHLLGVEVVPVSTHARDSFAVPAERVRAAITPKTRAFIIPSPGNPTGMVLSAADLAALGEVCVQAGIFFVADEVYREFVYPDEPAAADALPRAPSVLAVPGLAEHAVMIDSVSKRYSACGARVGCLVTRNAALYSACLRFAQARLSPPTVDQHAALAALRTPVAEMRAMVDEYRARRDLIVAGLNAIPGVSCPTPTGAFYLITDLPVADAEDFCIFMLRDFDLGGETMMMAPAEGFYATPGLGKNQVRIAYVLGRDKLARCLEILRAGLEAYSRRAR